LSSPTINVNITPGGGGGGSLSFASLETVMNLVRALVNDSQSGYTGTPGEGQIITDNPQISPFTQPFLNSSIRELYRELRNVGEPALIKDNIIVSGLTPVNGPQGLASPDPSLQVYLGFNGYFDGSTINSSLLLPSDVMYVERVWERQTGTNNSFTPMSQPQFGLEPRQQTPRLQEWEWRNYNINMVGSTQTNDIRLRYYCSLPQFFSENLDFDATFVPIIDCVDALAYKTAVKYATMLGSPGLADLKIDAVEQMRQLKLAHVRRSQSIDYIRIPYGSYNSNGGDNSGYLMGGGQ
jgi:hypothetical protein